MAKVFIIVFTFFKIITWIIALIFGSLGIYLSFTPKDRLINRVKKGLLNLPIPTSEKGTLRYILVICLYRIFGLVLIVFSIFTIYILITTNFNQSSAS